MKRVLKICAGTWENASHDKRELFVCQELGMETLVMAKGAPEDSFREDEVDGFKVYRFSTRPLGTARWLNPLNRVLSLLIWGRKARKFHADIITGHDLSGLFIGYLSNLGNSHKAKLVYDSHEFEIGRATNRSQAATWAVCRLERFLMNRCAFSIMVSDSIADEVQRIHRLKERPVVARNIPAYWELDEDAIARTRRELLSTLSLPPDTVLAIHHGHIVPDLALDNTLRAVSKVPGVALLLLGDIRDGQEPRIRALCGELGIADRVLLHPLVPLEELRNYAGAADFAAIIAHPIYKSYYFALPNKLFENIQSMTPVIVNNVPDKKKLVEGYGIGLAVDPESAEEIAAAIRRLKDDKNFYAACMENLKRAKRELCWEKEKTALKEAYRRILP